VLVCIKKHVNGHACIGGVEQLVHLALCFTLPEGKLLQLESHRHDGIET
jgi:hypothetical protein